MVDALVVHGVHLEIPRCAHHRFNKLPLAMVTLWDMP